MVWELKLAEFRILRLVDEFFWEKSMFRRKTPIFEFFGFYLGNHCLAPPPGLKTTYIYEKVRKSTSKQ